MSILKLLAAGKSLVGMKDHSTPYRLCTRNALPKFESSKNPFNGTETAAAAPRPQSTVREKNNPFSPSAKPMVNLSLFDAELNPAGTAATAEESVAPSAAVNTPCASSEKAAKASAEKPIAAEAAAKPAAGVDPQPVAPKAAIVAPSLPAAKPVDRTHLSRPAGSSLYPDWMKKLNPLAYFSSREAEGNRPRGRSQVQGEFLLDNVKPVRNDLHDSDLEVVAARQPVREVIAPQPVAVEVTSSGDGIAGRITTRIFGGARLQAK
jgi:hypothetical protein